MLMLLCWKILSPKWSTIPTNFQYNRSFGETATSHWLVVSNIFYFHPYLGKWSNLTNIFQMGWNHQLAQVYKRLLNVIALPFSPLASDGLQRKQVSEQPPTALVVEVAEHFAKFWGETLALIYHGPPKPRFLEVFVVNHLIFRWPKPIVFHGFGGSWYLEPNWPLFLGLDYFAKFVFLASLYLENGISVNEYIYICLLVYLYLFRYIYQLSIFLSSGKTDGTVNVAEAVLWWLEGD